MNFKKLHPQALAPVRMRIGDAGYDLSLVEQVTIAAGQQATVKTGIAIAIPQSYVGLVLSRSGLAAKYGLHVSAGVIDSNYLGEICVVLCNHSAKSYTISVGERIAQILFIQVPLFEMIEVQDLELTNRGANGFGSSDLLVSTTCGNTGSGVPVGSQGLNSYSSSDFIK